MKKLLFILLFALLTVSSFSQNETGRKYIPWLEAQDITNNRYFIWHGDTIDFLFVTDSLMLLKSDSGIYVTPYTLDTTIANLPGGHSPVTLGTTAISGGITLNDQELSMTEVNSTTNGWLSWGDWVVFYNKLGFVTHDETLLGYGTPGNPLKVDTTYLKGLIFPIIDTMIQYARDTSTIPVISDLPYGELWDANLDGASKNTIYDAIEAAGGSGTDLTNTPAPTYITVISSTGLSTNLPPVDDTNAGLMLPEDKIKLNAVDTTLVIDSVYSVPHDQFPIEYLKYRQQDGTVVDITDVPKPNGLITGGIVTWISNLDFAISPSAYYIDGVLYTTSSETETLATGDATYSRIDLLVVNTAGEVTVIQGTPSSNPQAPTPDPQTELALTLVLILANGTTPEPPGPDPGEELVYDENVEWTVTGNGVTVDANSTISPYTGAKCIEVGTIGDEDYISFTTGTAVSYDWDNIILFLRLKEGVTKKSSLNIRFYLGGVAQTADIHLPFATLVTTWQNVSLNLSSVPFAAATFDEIRLRWNTVPSSLIMDGFYIDYVKLQGGTVTPPIYDLTVTLIGDVTGTGEGTILTTVGDDSHNHTIATLPNLVGSVDGVTNDGGDIDLVQAGMVGITPNDGTDEITITALATTDITLTGDGSSGNPLKADTTLLATIFNVNNTVINNYQTIDTARLVGTDLELSLENDGEAKKVIDLSSLDNSGTDDQIAIEVPITDAGNIITATEVENALQENRTAIDLNTAKETNTDNQDLTLTGNTLAISNDPNTDVDLAGYLDNTDDQKIDVLNLTGTDLHISLEDDGEADKTVDLSSLDNSGTDDQTAIEVPITDAGGYYDGTEVETALQEIGADIASGGDNWGSQVVVSDVSLSGTGITGNVLSVDDTQISITESQISDFGTYLTSEVDGSVTNELQTIDVSQLVGTELQLSLSSDGEATKTIDLSSLDDSGTDDQTIDIFAISGNDVQLSLESDGEATKTVDISTTTAVAANTAKDGNATHTGEVTGTTALTIADNVIDYGNVDETLKQNTTNNTLSWNVSGSGIITSAISSSGTVAFSNAQVNKFFTVVLTISSGATISWPSTAKILDGSATLGDGTFYVYIHCISSTLYTVSITKEAA